MERGERQKDVTDKYRDNWSSIFSKKSNDKEKEQETKTQ